MTVVHTGDIKDCCCDRSIENYEQYERSIFNKKMNDKNKQIQDLLKYNAQLNRIIKRLIKK